jgi:RNA polymerase sigma factor (sigma-70 family)
MSGVMSDDRADVLAVQAARTRASEDATAAQCAHAAFARIYDRHAPVVLALCRGETRTDEDAHDALQETFIRAYRKIDDVHDSTGSAEGSGGLRSWLYQIARHVCSEKRRADGRRTKHEQEARVNGSANIIRSEREANERPPARSEQGDRLEMLTRALGELPDQERLAIHLFYLDADPAVAAREALGVSRSGFYKLLARARERLGMLMGSVTP